MATTTAIILIGKTHPNHSGIIPTHIIRLTENSSPTLILQSIIDNKDKKTIIPTLENIVDDIYLMISIFILNKLESYENINCKESLYNVLKKEERLKLYSKSKQIIKESEIKVVFNLLDNCYLLDKINDIKNYPNDLEITIPIVKKEYNYWKNKIEVLNFKIKK